MHRARIIEYVGLHKIHVSRAVFGSVVFMILDMMNRINGQDFKSELDILLVIWIES